ncbi:MAG: GDSL-type esterase/lipase family protein [Candidatus Ventricola sp.]
MRQILCYGDSNTWGLIPGTLDRYPWDTRWTGILQSMLCSRGVRVIEEGLCGRTTAFEDTDRAGRNGAAMLPVLLESHCPLDGAILMLGTNDCKSAYRLNPEQIARGAEQCVDLFLSAVLPGFSLQHPDRN